MKDRVLKTLNLILFFFAVLVVVGQALAWFMVEQITVDLSFGGSSTSAYFAGGSGKEGDPYIITTAQHMYNLAWLQDKGLLQETGTNGTTNTKFYFKVNADVDMDGMVLPPIGTTANPFNSVFNGGGHTISNLSVSTDIDVLTSAADKTIVFSNYVGMFGATGADSNINSFILSNPKVEVAEVNISTKDSGSPTYVKYSSSANGMVGIVVGNVQGKVTSIGVKGGELSIQKSGYSTFNSILGNLGDNVTSSVTGGGSMAGDGNSFGTSFNVSGLLTRLKAIAANKASDSPSWLLPDIDTTNKNPVVAKLGKIPFSVTSTSTYENSVDASGNTILAKEVISNINVGYFFGNQNKITEKTLTFGDKLVSYNGTYQVKSTKSSTTTYADPTDSTVPNWFYSYTTSGGSYNTGDQVPSYSTSVLKPIDDSTYSELSDDIKALLPSSVGQKITYEPVRISQTFTNSGPYTNTDNNGWSFHGQISWNGNTYGKGFKYTDGTVVNEDGTRSYKTLVNYTWGGSAYTGDMYNDYGGYVNFADYKGGIYLPNSAIWFKPTMEGKVRFVMYAESSGDGFALIRITRNGATADNPFHSDINDDGVWSASDIKFEEAIKAKLPAHVLIYYEMDVTADVDAGNVEYMLMQYGNGGAYFLYLDIGASGDNNVSSGDGSVANGYSVSGVDFVYENVEIDSQSGNFIDTTTNALYLATGRSIYFSECSAGLYIVFERSARSQFKVTASTINSADNNVKHGGSGTSGVTFIFNTGIISNNFVIFDLSYYNSSDNN